MMPNATVHPDFNLRAKLRLRRRPLISLTPLIDVVFILLIFFMLASSFLDWRTIRLEAPANASAGQSVEGSMLIRILSSGDLDLNGSRVTETELDRRITSRLASHPEQSLLIQPESGVPLQQAVSLLDRLTALGGRHVSFLRSQ